MNYEIIGIAGSFLIIIAFLMKGEKNIRVMDAVGALLFVIYGCLIGSFSTVLLNTVLIAVQIINLRRILKDSSKQGKN